MKPAVKKGDRRCPNCDAVVAAGDPRCWLCRGSLVAGAAPVPKVAGTPSSWGGARSAVALGTGALVLTVALVTLGLTMYMPGLGMAVAVAVVPITLHLALLVLRRSRTGERVRAGEIIVIAAGWTSASIVVFVMVPILIAGALILALAAICAGLMSGAK